MEVESGYDMAEDDDADAKVAEVEASMGWNAAGWRGKALTRMMNRKRLKQTLIWRVQPPTACLCDMFHRMEARRRLGGC